MECRHRSRLWMRKNWNRFTKYRTRKKGSLIYIELHKSLFPPESEAYGDLNRFFANVSEDAIDIRIDGTDIRTMGYTDHLFYLIFHSFQAFPAQWIRHPAGMRYHIICQWIRGMRLTGRRF